jgi:VanZ family protein
MIPTIGNQEASPWVIEGPQFLLGGAISGGRLKERDLDCHRFLISQFPVAAFSMNDNTSESDRLQANSASIGPARKLCLLMLAGYWSALFYLTHTPPSKLPRLPRIRMIDKWAHFLAYSGLAFLFLCSLKYRQRNSFSDLKLTFGVLAIYGVLDELLQIPVGRTASFYDFVADLVGVVFGSLLAILLRKAMVVKESPQA